MALDSSGPFTTSDVAISPPALAPTISSTISLPEQPVATTSSGTYSSSINFNLNAEPFEPYPYPRTDFPHYNIQMPNIGDVSAVNHVVGSCLVGSPGGHGGSKLSAVVKIYPDIRM